MCGIAGFLDPRASTSADALTATVETMAASLNHRGPDDHGSWVDGEAGIALGFRRLAIIDLSPAGHQPMVSSCGRYVLVYNGEIYNAAELRRDLEAAGRTFRGHCDSEVLVEASLDPYEHESLRTCNDIRAEIAAIDRILGADFDTAEASDRDISAGRIARTLVRSFIPFRRIIREISGAEDRERQIEIAVTASMVRRGYLKGLGQARGCDYPSRPHENRIIRERETEDED